MLSMTRSEPSKVISNPTVANQPNSQSQEARWPKLEMKCSFSNQIHSCRLPDKMPQTGQSLQEVVTRFGLRVPYMTSGGVGNILERKEGNIFIIYSKVFIDSIDKVLCVKAPESNKKRPSYSSTHPTFSSGFLSLHRAASDRVTNLLTYTTFGRKDFTNPSRRRPKASGHASQQSAEHLAQLKEIFQLHDTEGRGLLTKDQLRSCLLSLGHNPSHRQLWRFFAIVDVDHSGLLDFQEFISLMSGFMYSWDPQSDLRACWEVLDPQARGKVRCGVGLWTITNISASINFWNLIFSDSGPH